jgi:hypothetical protein
VQIGVERIRESRGVGLGRQRSKYSAGGQGVSTVTDGDMFELYGLTDWCSGMVVTIGLDRANRWTLY